jgi:hypothetical protein
MVSKNKVFLFGQNRMDSAQTKSLFLNRRKRLLNYRLNISYVIQFILCVVGGPVLDVVHGRAALGRARRVRGLVGAVRGRAAGVVHGCAVRGHARRAVDAAGAVRVRVRYAFHLTCPTP